MAAVVVVVWVGGLGGRGGGRGLRVVGVGVRFLEESLPLRGRRGGGGGAEIVGAVWGGKEGYGRGGGLVELCVSLLAELGRQVGGRVAQDGGRGGGTVVPGRHFGCG